ncbi:hypothetical protein HHI36_004910 [Cryptolaemus montrouzieri]|uniref:CHK kinase-like domain-containing protein n=1 Tax=Cryptolaemus montrouzieri TaxID=559131 RepID=A0ABD2NSW2_9CUCU
MEDITEEQIKRMLYEINSNFLMISYVVKPLEEENGLIAQHFSLRIFYKLERKLKELQLFLKTLNKNSPTVYNMSVRMLVFEKEQLFYMRLLPNFEKKGIDISYAPRGYLCENQAVIMEDLSIQGFKLSSKDKFSDLEHCQFCLATLAKFHISSILYEVCVTNSSGKPYNLQEEHPEQLIDVIYYGADEYLAKYVEQSLKGLIGLAEIQFGDTIDLNKLRDQFNSETSTKSTDMPEMRCTILHGDLWSNNFLHKYDDNGKHIETKLIDFQLIKYGPPALDVLNFIFMNTTKSFRDKHSTYLLTFYFQKFEEFLLNRGLDVADILPKKNFLESCENLKRLAKIQAMVDLSLVCVPDEFMFETLIDDEKCKDFLLLNRKHYLEDIYNNYSEFREILYEHLLELKEMFDICC